MSFAIFLTALWPSAARADGGVVRLSQRHGDLQITVFTAPTPWQVGPVDVSVLVQQAATGEPLLEEEVWIALLALDGSTPALRQRASSAAATNKLFQAAEFHLPSAGRWRVEVALPGRGADVASGFELEAAAPPPPWQRLAPWLVWPVAAIVLFAVHQCLVRRRPPLTDAQASSTLTAPDR